MFEPQAGHPGDRLVLRRPAAVAVVRRKDPVEVGRRDPEDPVGRQRPAALHEAGETHHRVFRIVDGADDDWASWYADWLVNLSELAAMLGVTSVSVVKHPQSLVLGDTTLA